MSERAYWRTVLLSWRTVTDAAVAMMVYLMCERHVGVSVALLLALYWLLHGFQHRALEAQREAISGMLDLWSRRHEP